VLDRRQSAKIGFVDRLMLRFSVSATVDGLWIGALEGKKEGEPLLRRVSEALQLIKTYDPLRYKRVLRELERIWVCVLLGNVACYVASRKGCDIDPRFVLSYSPEQLASVIVHEATHGVLHRRHIGYSEALRERVEKVCVRQELAFARKLPNGEAALEAAESALALPPETWSDLSFRNRHREGALTTAPYLGIPLWFMRAVLRIGERRAARRQRA
jgi:hypothetical protein